MTSNKVDTTLPHSARAYGWMLGLKDNFSADREFLLNLLPNFPECLDISRQNRQFLYRAVSSQPVAVLYLSVGHHLKDDPGGGLAGARDTLHAVIDHAATGSHIAASQVVCDDPVRGLAFGSAIDAAGIPWQSRTPEEFTALLDGLTPLDPGLVNLKEWRPDPAQPQLPSVDPALKPFEGRAQGSNLYEYSGVLML
ncbi:SAM-dependent methyltransferase [Actinomadura decatromicini]|uniref:Uncharacterized protein n=1 Tax=Actinomadura decatromicini TaxID=2604572 RepID=A0A5D3G210_9ACTN|nr:SAM-dependent methyltransferase [Actinomadura decatromicini]TYK53585.1 hypothetical protein FXF68_02310 [Actinomadura decatromicini]